MAEKGDTIINKSGNIIVFPPNSLVDKSEKPISGKVDLMYREFINPLDFFVSGIPMNYETGGKKYNFESSGMSEIRATQNGVPLYTLCIGVNQSVRIRC